VIPRVQLFAGPLADALKYTFKYSFEDIFKNAFEQFSDEQSPIARYVRVAHHLGV
jgi:hypothetical protein